MNLKNVLVAVIAAIVALIGCKVFDLGSTDSGAATLKPKFSGSPKEFLYLDSLRVASYLAQIDGGAVESEKLARKLTQSFNAKLAVEKLGETGGSSANESFAERVVKPTAESSFFALLTALEDAGKKDEAKSIKLANLKDVESLGEGRFVKFETRGVRFPPYLNAYLAVRNVNTVAAIFPRSEEGRTAARAFFDKVGETPRVVVSLWRAGSSNVGQGAKPGPFVYLLPMSAPLLTSERSLLKYGGGKFTVVGKIVRQFREGSVDRDRAYVDSPTLETWEQALLHAPGELLCRTHLWCATQARTKPRPQGEERQTLIKASRKRILASLRRRTVIRQRGTVILPVAIYK